MDKQEYFLKKHGIVLDKRRSPEEQNQQMKLGFGVKDIETGDRPYIFISYSHKDSAVVFPAIKALQEKGYPVWYDDSIRTGVAWRTHIAERVRDSALVIAFMSENSVASKNCIAEVDHAIDLNLPILTVRLDQSQIPSGLGMYLNRDQMFLAYLYDGDTYITRLAADPTIAETAGAALDAYNAEKRRAAEEAQQKIRKAEEAERKRQQEEKRRLQEEEARKKAEEEEQARLIRVQNEAAKSRERLKKELEQKQKDLEEADRMHRMHTAAQIKRLKAQMEALNEQDEEAKRSYTDLIQSNKLYQDALAELQLERAMRISAEEKCQETANLLEKERKKNRETENQRSNEQRRIANLEAAAKKREETERITPEMRVQKAELAALHDAVQDLLLEQTYTSYRNAIGLYNNHMKPMAESNQKLKPDMKNYKNTICKTLYRDARILERKKQKRMAYALYNALPERFSDVGAHKRKIEEHTEKVCRISAILVFGLCMVVTGLLVHYFYGESFWFNTLISEVPMIAAVCLWCVCNRKWFSVDHRKIFSEICFVGISISALILMIACLFLYPEMEMWKKIVTSVLYNGLSGIIGIALLLIPTYALDEKEYCNIKKISD